MEGLTKDEQATNFDTCLHIQNVQHYMHIIIKDMLDRIEEHDQSKLSHPEVEAFTEHTSKLAGLTYGSPEFDACKKAMGPALAHHYANNRHHPEHYKNGIIDMNLVDLLEMFCDWKASSTRHNDGNIRKSIEINGNRFNLSPQLITIFENTAELFD